MQVQYDPNKKLEPQLKRMVKLTQDGMQSYGYLGKSYSTPLQSYKLTDFTQLILFQCMEHIKRNATRP